MPRKGSKDEGGKAALKKKKTTSKKTTKAKTTKASSKNHKPTARKKTPTKRNTKKTTKTTTRRKARNEAHNPASNGRGTASRPGNNGQASPTAQPQARGFQPYPPFSPQTWSIAPEHQDYQRFAPSKTEILMDIWALFVRGKTMTFIADELRQRYNVPLSHNTVVKWIQHGAMNHEIIMRPPRNLVVEQKLKRKFPALVDIIVCDGRKVEGVASLGAEYLWGLILQTYRRKRSDIETAMCDAVHMGMSGGHTLRSLSKYLAFYLADHFLPNVNHEDSLPNKLFFHALVSGFDVHDPTTEPNSMFQQFLLEGSSCQHIKFVGLHAFPTVTQEAFASCKTAPFVKESFEEAGNIDIVVTSMGMWKDPDCMHRRAMFGCRDTVKELEGEGIIGDVMWLPISETGPITHKTRTRAATVMELADLAQMIRRNKQVMLVVGPCRNGKTKTEALQHLLRFEQPLVTHLVLDSLTAQELLEV